MQSIRLFESDMASWLARRKSFLTGAVFAAALALASTAAFAQQGPPKADEHPGGGHRGMMMGDMGSMHAKMMAKMSSMHDSMMMHMGQPAAAAGDHADHHEAAK